MSSPGITKQALVGAMKQLMAERPLSKINVHDIVELCGLNRNSFYYHFRDKYDLVNWIFYTGLVEELAGESPRWPPVERICRYLYDNRAFYMNALSVTGQNSFEEYYRELLRTLVASWFPQPPSGGIHGELCVDFLVDAFSATTIRWLKNGAATPPDELADGIKKAAVTAAGMILEGFTQGQASDSSASCASE